MCFLCKVFFVHVPRRLVWTVVLSSCRQGSGSACRSVLGGFAAWHMGSASDGSDSYAEEIASDDHWPEMKILVAVVRSSDL